MPEGIVPELLIVAFLVAVVAAGLVVQGRRGRPEETPEDAAIAVEERPAIQVQPEGLVVEPPPGTPAVEAPPTIVLEEPEEIVLEPPEEIEVVAPAPEEPARPTLRERLAKSRAFLSDRITAAFGGAEEEVWEDLEAALIQGDVGVATAGKIVEEVRANAPGRSARSPEEVRGLVADALVARFDQGHDRGLVMGDEPPTTWLVLGVNGTGKTTTIGKLACDLNERGRKVAIAAADTFRAAADEQLDVWAKRAGASVVKHQPGADPAAVAFDAHQFARARGFDVLMIDTAGRLHTKTPLMDELAKIRRVVEKDGAVHEALLVIDATAGQNGLVQAREFADAAGVSGVVLTKLDGTAKGGIALAIEDTLGIPIKLIGVGESADDLEPFEPKAFVDALLA